MQRVAGRRAGGPAHAAGSRRVANHTGGGGGVSGTASHGEWAAGATRRVPSECPAQKGYCSFLLHQLQTRVSIANRVCQWWFHAVTGSCRLGLPPPTVPVGGGAGRCGGGPGEGGGRAGGAGFKVPLPLLVRIGLVATSGSAECRAGAAASREFQCADPGTTCEAHQARLGPIPSAAHLHVSAEK